MSALQEMDGSTLTVCHHEQRPFLDAPDLAVQKCRAPVNSSLSTSTPAGLLTPINGVLLQLWICQRNRLSDVCRFANFSSVSPGDTNPLGLSRFNLPYSHRLSYDPSMPNHHHSVPSDSR